MAELTPEQQARQNIDVLLTSAGWHVQDYKAYDPSVSIGVALREVPLKSGRCDYLLMVNRQPLGVVEAKKEGAKLSIVAEHATGIKGKESQEIDIPTFTKAQTELITAACAPFDKPALRDVLTKAKQDSEQAIATSVIDEVISQGFSAAARDKAAALAASFRDYIDAHQSEITALQILYSRPYAQRLTEPMLKELEKKLREQHAAWTEDNLWNAFAATAPDKVIGRTQAGRFADLVSLVRFALEQQPVLAPFADSVHQRFAGWLAAKGDQAFTAEQLPWLHSIRDHIATSLSIELEDLDYTPFNQEGGLGKAHQLFGDQLPKLLEELNGALAA